MSRDAYIYRDESFLWPAFPCLADIGNWGGKVELGQSTKDFIFSELDKLQERLAAREEEQVALRNTVSSLAASLQSVRDELKVAAAEPVPEPWEADWSQAPNWAVAWMVEPTPTLGLDTARAGWFGYLRADYGYIKLRYQRVWYGTFPSVLKPDGFTSFRSERDE